MTDFFISYTSADRTWAEWIAWQLEEAGYSTIIQAWDFGVGGDFVQAMQSATTCDRTIAVLSPRYLKSGFTSAEWHAAFQQDPTGEKKLLVPVRIEECDPIQMGLFRARIYVDLVGTGEAEAKEKLLAALKTGRAKPTTTPGFPGGQKHKVAKPETFPGTATSDNNQTPGESESARPTNQPSGVDRTAFIEHLYGLLDEDFDKLLLHLPGGRSRITQNAGIQRRANELIAWAESSAGPGLDAVMKAAKENDLFPR